jgi:hypothetical protein
MDKPANQPPSPSQKFSLGLIASCLGGIISLLLVVGIIYASQPDAPQGSAYIIFLIFPLLLVSGIGLIVSIVETIIAHKRGKTSKLSTTGIWIGAVPVVLILAFLASSLIQP